MINLSRIHHRINQHSQMLWTLLLISIPLVANTQNYDIQRFDVEQGLPQPYIYTLNQDQAGYLWVGTGNGLARYDGYSFQVYTVEDSLADNYVSASFNTENGIWFGHMSGDLSFYSDNKFTKYILPDEEKTLIPCMERDPSDILWAGSYSNGFLKISEKQEIQAVKFDSDEPIIINSFSFLDENELLVGSLNGLSVWNYQKSEKLTFIEQISDIPAVKIADIIKLNNSYSYLVATQDNGIFKLTKQEKKYQVSRINPENTENIKGIQSVMLDSDSTIWIGTFGSGIYNYELNSNNSYDSLIHFNTEYGLKSDYIKVLFEDREGLIWIGSYGAGLDKILEKPYTYFEFDEETVGNNIQSISIDNHYRWIGTDKGLIKSDDITGKILKFYDGKNGLPNDNITAILQTPNLLWLGTSQNGVFLFDPLKEEAVKFDISDGMLENNITAITGTEDLIWVGTKKGICKIQPSLDSIKWYTIQNGGLPHNSVNDVYMDSKGKTWVSTHCNILSVFENDSLSKFPISVENGNFTLNSIAEDGKGNIWVGSLGRGVFLLNESQYANIDTYNGLFSEFCYSIVYDGLGSIWISHKGGLSKIDEKNFYVKSIQQNFEIAKSYEFNNNAVFLNRAETIYFGFNKGLLAVNNKKENSISEPPKLIITSILINDKEVELKDKFKLKPGRYKFQVEYVGINLTEPELTNYKYRMEGYDGFPVNTRGTRVIYPSLTDGKYTFHLSATSAEGITSQKPISFSIWIRTPFWRLPWFYGILILLILLAIIYSIRREQKRGYLENKRLEQKVKERTDEIEERNNRIKEQHNLIREKNKDITDSIKYASYIQTAISPTIDGVRELLPNCFIINKPRDIVSGDFYWIARKNGKILVVVADCSGHGVPGAFISILGTRLLNDIVQRTDLWTPDKILDKLRSEVIRALRQDHDSTSSSDTINMGICSLDFEKMQLQYSGALTPLVYIHNGEQTVIKSNRFPLGISYHKKAPFTLHELPIHKGDMLYMYSDGFQDQFGGGDNKKFTSKRLLKTLLKYSSHSIVDQELMLNKTFFKWKGVNPQTDDVIVMGVQI